MGADYVKKSVKKNKKGSDEDVSYELPHTVRITTDVACSLSDPTYPYPYPYNTYFINDPICLTLSIL